MTNPPSFKKLARALGLGEKFWKLVKTHPAPEHCWEWRGRLDPNGYGIFAPGKVLTGSNRAQRFMLAWQLDRIIPNDAMVCHHCDNPICVNPKHLYEGDAWTNGNDLARRGPSRHRRRVQSEYERRNHTRLKARGEAEIAARKLARQIESAQYDAHYNTLPEPDEK